MIYVSDPSQHPLADTDGLAFCRQPVRAAFHSISRPRGREQYPGVVGAACTRVPYSVTEWAAEGSMFG
jgi:hypothetical protein